MPQFSWDDMDDAPQAAPSAGGKFDWDSMPDHPDQPSPGILKSAMDKVNWGLQKIDSVTGAPTRAAIGAIENGNNPLGAAWDQFGADTSKAPTGKQLLSGAGINLPESPIPFNPPVAILNALGYKPTWNDAAGAAVEAAANPVNLIPGVGEAKAAESVADAASGASSAAKVPGAAAKFGGKVAETMTGVNDRMASNYMANTDRINDIISDYKGPDGYQTAEHAADIRNNWNDKIQATKKDLNGNIDAALAKAPKNASIPLTPIIDNLEKAKAGLDPSLDADKAAISQINGLQDEVKQAALAGQNDLATNPQKLNRLKQIFQDKAKSSYMPDGTVFQPAPAVSKASKGAAAVMRQSLNTAVPEVAQANNGLAALHDVEDTMNSTLLKPEGNVSALTRAGADPNGMEARTLQKLQGITGYNFGQDAKDFATARTFADPKFTPDFNGKSLFRMGLGGGIGAVANHLGIPAEMAYPAGLAATSPAALKAGINIGQATADVVSGPAKAGLNAASSPMGKAVGNISSQSNGIRIPVPALVQNQTTKGPDAWAQQGVKNLGIDDSTASQLLKDQKGKQLLIQASSFPPGSKGLKNILAQIQKGWGQS